MQRLILLIVLVLVTGCRSGSQTQQNGLLVRYDSGERQIQFSLPAGSGHSTVVIPNDGFAFVENHGRRWTLDGVELLAADNVKLNEALWSHQSVVAIQEGMCVSFNVANGLKGHIAISVKRERFRSDLLLKLRQEGTLVWTGNLRFRL